MGTACNIPAGVVVKARAPDVTACVNKFRAGVEIPIVRKFPPKKSRREKKSGGRM